MALNLVQVKEQGGRSAPAGQENYNLRGSGCWMGFKGQVQGGLMGELGFVGWVVGF